MVMVFKNKMLLGRVETLYPEVASLFRSLAGVISTPAEKGKVQQIYRDLRALNFSTDILEKIATRFPASISVLPVLQVTWSDWASQRRLAETKRSIERRYPLRNASAATTVPIAAVARQRQLR